MSRLATIRGWRVVVLGSAALALAPVPRARGQAAGDERPPELARDVTDAFIVPAGLQVTVWAASPQFFNPTNVDVDARGRLWVTEAVNYRRFNTAKEGRLVHPNGDRVVILEDTDGDGACDASKVFVEDPELVSPLGIAVFGPPQGRSEVWVSCSPHLFKYVDEDGDDRPERREIVLTGFGGLDHDHGLHAVIAGPDGLLYFNAGNAGPHVVTDRAGFTLRAGSFAGGEGGMRSDDGRIAIGGLALRMRSDATGLELLAHNFRNCYEVAIDSYGDLWQNDNDDDGNEGCRIAWVMRGANQGYASADGRRSWQVDRRPGQERLAAHWHQEDPGVAPLGCGTGAGGPTGIVVNEGDGLGARFDGALLSCDAGRNTIWCVQPEPAGAGFAMKAEVFLSSVGEGRDRRDPHASWFRPSDVVVGLDGALFVADWWDAGVGGHGMHDDVGGGRILKIAPRGADPAAFRRALPDLSTVEGCIRALALPALNVRRAAFTELAREPQHLARWVDAMRAAQGRMKARLLWLIATAGEKGAAIVRAVLEDPDPRLRVLALRAAPPPWTRGAPSEAWGRLAADPSPLVRREVAVALRDKDFATRRELLVTLAGLVDGTDRTFLEAFGSACEGCEDALWPELAAKYGDTPLQWSARFASLAWRLHPVAAIDGLLARALAPELDGARQREAVTALAFVHDIAAAEAMVRIALEGPPDVQALAAFWIRLRSAGEWKEFRVAEQLGLGAHDESDLRWKSGVVTSGVRELSVDLTGARALWLIADDGPDGHGFDWADWIEPLLHGPGGETRLTELPWFAASCDWGTTQIDRDASGGSLEVDGVPAAFGIGTHAWSEIGFRLPPGRFTRFTAKVGPDDGGTRQAGAHTSIEFRVYVDAADGRAKAFIAKTRMLAADTPARERQKIAGELARDPDGGMVLIELAARGDLPDELRDVVARTIFKNPDLSVRALASESFPRATDDGVPLPPVAELLALPADGARGRDVYFSERAGCAKCHLFRNEQGAKGGDVGPELTTIHTKYGKPELFDAILNPNGAISFGFEAWLVELKDGTLLTGFLLADGDPLVLKDTTGKRITVAATDVAQRRKSSLSVMPDNVALGLTAQELADLVEFLKNGR